ncbi:Similar to TTC1: Tetratricopeptide repeat protein 1 (Homo sapiens) [Cotesia congregata]|uniref:Similar to TTC1: Tetratricopeptide repeat protein 1 (Homo sapiens) n=1 Tax=Cotesia congregata TaxID=51543 RepID=A0A8J2EDN0_COTCN|nr:Similar to TTC1: Tetratricopeptide repeat protein 1 (Homo sapiens) [Cotesia congregata]
MEKSDKDSIPSNEAIIDELTKDLENSCVKSEPEEQSTQGVSSEPDFDCEEKPPEKDFESAIKDCTKAVELNPAYLKAYLRRAQLYEQTDNLDQSLADYKKILELDPGHSEAHHAVRRLPPLIEEKNEKLKEEMLGKLKDLGNMILKPFGLSTNNFQLDKDPSTGGYSVKFNQGNT